MATKTMQDPREAYAKAQDLLAERRTERDDAVEHRDELKARLARGDASVTAEQLSVSGAAVQRAEALVSAAHKSVNAAKNALPVDPVLCRTIASTVAQGIGCDVNVSESRITEADVSPFLPCGILRPTQTKVDRRSGSMSGEAELSYLHSPLQGSADADALQRRLREAGLHHCDVRSRGSRSLGGATVETFTVIVPHATASLPEITGEPGQGHWRSAEVSLAASVPVGIVAQAKVNPASVAITQSGDHRTIDAEFEIVLAPKPGAGDRNTVTRVLPAILSGWQGLFVSGLGRISDATAGQTEAAEHDGVALAVAVAFVARAAS